MKKGMKGKTTVERTSTGDAPGKAGALKPKAAKMAPAKKDYKNKPF
jgi:hypothetical protein